MPWCGAPCRVACITIQYHEMLIIITHYHHHRHHYKNNENNLDDHAGCDDAEHCSVYNPHSYCSINTWVVHTFHTTAVLITRGWTYIQCFRCYRGRDTPTWLLTVEHHSKPSLIAKAWQQTPEATTCPALLAACLNSSLRNIFIDS